MFLCLIQKCVIQTEIHLVKNLPCHGILSQAGVTK